MYVFIIYIYIYRCVIYVNINTCVNMHLIKQAGMYKIIHIYASDVR